MKFRHRERSSGDEFQISNVNYKFSYRVHIETDGRRSPAEIADEVRETLYTCPDENSSTRGELVFFFFFITGDDGGAVENFIFSPNNIVGYQIFRFPLSWIEADCGESAICWRV